MPDFNRMIKDKATILAIVKYLLLILVIGITIYAGFQVFRVLLPFVIGLILARTSIFLSTVTHNAIHRLRHSKEAPEKADLIVPPSSEAMAELGLTEKGEYPEGLEVEDAIAAGHEKSKSALFRKGTRLAVFYYTLLVISFIALFLGVIVISANQLRSLINFMPGLVGDSSLAQRLVDSLDGLLSRLGIVLSDQILVMIRSGLTNLLTRLVEAIPGAASAVLNGLAKFLGNLPAVLLIIIVTIMSGYYFIADSRSLYLFLRRNLRSKSFLEKSVRLVNILSATLFRIIGGYALLLVITFILVLIGLMIVKMPYAVIVALIAAIVDFLPVLGLSATLIPISIYMLINGNLWGGIGVLILLGAITVIRRIIEPPIVGTAMSLHPMATLFSMIAGIAVYGLSGVLIGPLILVIAKEIFVQFGFDSKLRKLVGDLLNRVSN